MRPFRYYRALDVADAVAAIGSDGVFLGGGTSLVDLARTGAISPGAFVDTTRLTGATDGVRITDTGVVIGAMATMATLESHPIIRSQYPVVSAALAVSASAQIRNMARIGGNLMQQTRCTYFRDPSWPRCNKRTPGSGCQALSGVAHAHAVLGGSERCVALYHGDLAQALIALDATILVEGGTGRRSFPMSRLHRAPGDAPDRGSNLATDDLIVAVHLPRAAWLARGAYVKLRDRASFEFATASAAAVLDLQDGTVRQARLALGGVATTPWRSLAAERHLVGRPLDVRTAEAAATVAFSDAARGTASDYKIELGKRAVIEALLHAKAVTLA